MEINLGEEMSSIRGVFFNGQTLCNGVRDGGVGGLRWVAGGLSGRCVGRMRGSWPKGARRDWNRALYM